MNNMSKLLIVIVIITFACSDSGSRRADAVRDSAGIRIIEAAPPTTEWTVADSPVLRIGVIEGDSAYQFHNVSYATRLSDGRIVVANGGTEMRWFSPQGTHLSTLGGRGDGPGEFRSIRSAVVAPGDTVVVYDGASQRLTWLSPDGALLRVRPLDISGRQGVRLLASRPDAIALVAESRPTVNFGGESFNYTRDTLIVTTHGLESTDTIASVVGSEATTWVYYENARPTRTMQMDIPFGHLALAAATTRLVILAATERNELTLLDDSGRVQSLVRGSGTGPLPADHRSRLAAHAEQQAIDRGAPDPQSIRRGVEDRLVLLASDHTIPAFDQILVDRADRIWLRDYVPGWALDLPQSWQVYDPDGFPLARVTTPGGLTVTSISEDHVVGIEPDELGVQYVVAYVLERHR